MAKNFLLPNFPNDGLEKFASHEIAPLNLVFNDTKDKNEDHSVSDFGFQPVIPRYLSSVPIQFVAQYSQPSVLVSDTPELSGLGSTLDHQAVSAAQTKQNSSPSQQSYSHTISNGFRTNHSRPSALDSPTPLNGHQPPNNPHAVDFAVHRAREAAIAAVRSKGNTGSLSLSRNVGRERPRHHRALIAVLLALLADLLFTIGAFNRRSAEFHSGYNFTHYFPESSRHYFPEPSRKRRTEPHISPCSLALCVLRPSSSFSPARPCASQPTPCVSSRPQLL